MVQELPLADELAAVFARMSGLLMSEETTSTAVNLVTALAREAIPGAVGAGVTLVDDRGGKTTSGASDPVVEKADSMQYELDEGPCLTSWAQRALVRLDEIGSDGRWPRWSRAVEPLGLRAAMSAPLVAGDRSLGAIKVYAQQPGRIRPSRRAPAADVRRPGGDPAGQRPVDGERPPAQRWTQGRAAQPGRDRHRERDSDGPRGHRRGTAFAVLVASAQREHKTLRDTAHALARSTVRRGH